MTSPPWLVPSACHVTQAMLLLTKRVLPSHIPTFTPPEWRLRAVKTFRLTPGTGMAWQGAFKGFCDGGTHPGAPLPLEM
jgi:hypothetical protein